MGLYHRTHFIFLCSAVLFAFSLIISGCASSTPLTEKISVIITADGVDTPITISTGGTVSEALKSANITLGGADKVVPTSSTKLTNGSIVKVMRVRDEYYTKQVPIPFPHQELTTNALPAGEKRLSQAGENGIEEFTYHRVLEDSIEVSNTVVNSSIIKEAVPEIVMIGDRQAFSPIDIPGKLAYLAAGNAWIMETNTGQRSCVVCTGDLDGRIFSLSPNGNFLLFTRRADNTNLINNLWVASLRYDPARLIDLNAENIVLSAEFSPDSSAVAYSTAEWREAAPGWQANNDLYELTVSRSGFLGEPQMNLDTNSGGVYGWWGSIFSWAPLQDYFVYSRPDGIGLVNPKDQSQTVLHPILPYQTGGYWAWIPGVSWAPDGSIIYTIDHASLASTGGGEYQEFDLIGVPVSGAEPIDLVKNVGMFAYPVASPLYTESIPGAGNGELAGEKTFSVAYLQAIFPEQSDRSGYRLFTISRDGSDQQSLFPAEGSIGLNPQQVVWSPEGFANDNQLAIAVIYNGNIWIIHTGTGEAQQITGDGLISRIDWR